MHRYSQLRDGNTRLTDAQRSQVAIFIALLHARTPITRTNLERIASTVIERQARERALSPEFPQSMRLANQAPEMSDEHVESLRQLLIRPGAIRCKIDPRFSLETIITITDRLSRIIFQMSWRYAVAPLGCHFLTNDNPLFWDDPDAPQPLRNGLASRNTILTIPLGREVALVASWIENAERLERVPEKVVTDINDRTISTADRWIFASRKEEAARALARWKFLKDHGHPIGPRRVLVSDN